MPGMIREDTPSLSLSSSVSASTQSFSSLSNLPPHHSALSSVNGPTQHLWLQELRSEERGLYLIQLLLSCANAVACNNMEYSNVFLEQLTLLASLTGDPMQRVATYFMEGLAARITKSWPGVYRALNSTQLPSIVDMLSARQVFFSVCPYLKFAFLTVNQAILDAMEGEKVVHLIDLEASDPVQWLALLQALSVRPGGPPHLRITGVSERRAVLEQTGQRLSIEAEKLDIPFQFHPVHAQLENLDIELLRVKTGEAVAISSVMRLHPLLAKDSRFSGSGGQPSSFDGSRGRVGSTRGQTFQEVGHFRGEGNSSVGTCSQPQAQVRDCAVKRPREVSDEEVELVHGSVGDSRFDGSSAGVHADGELATTGKSCVTTDGGLTLVERDRPTSNLVSTHAQEETCVIATEESAAHEASGGAIDQVLRTLRCLSPKVMVVVEQESSHNGPTLLERFIEALHYYCAMFDSLDSTLPQQCPERVTLEKHLFGQEIKNIVACEGVERVERHEKLEKWRKRMENAGFQMLALSQPTVLQAKRLLHCYACDGYRLLEKDGCLTLCWQDTPLYSASAWHA
ncbi:hypothetical protein CY35_18G016100 [Sphagnum magellanicum]|nr:hypothetical protein CY35_18G016100 [Sphagnum magellanicum]